MIKIGFWVKDSKNKYFCNICGCPAIYHIKNNKWELVKTYAFAQKKARKKLM